MSMIVTVDDDQWRIQFKHDRGYSYDETREKSFRSCECQLEIADPDNPYISDDGKPRTRWVPKAKGIARCEFGDNYAREGGRQRSLRSAYRNLKKVGEIPKRVGVTIIQAYFEQVAKGYKPEVLRGTEVSEDQAESSKVETVAAAG